MSIRTKLALAFVALALAGLFPTLWATYLAVRSAATHRIEEDLVSTVQQLDSHVRQLQELVRAQVQANLMQAQYLEAFDRAKKLPPNGLEAEDADPKALAAAHDLLASADLPLLRGRDIVLVLNNAGRVLYNAGSKEEVGSDLSSVALVSEALSGRQGWDLWSMPALHELPQRLLGNTMSQDHLYLVTAQPLEMEGHVLGVVVIGQGAGTELIPRLEALAQADVALQAVDGTVMASSKPAQEAVSQLPLGPPRLVDLGGRQFVAQAQDLKFGERRVGRAFVLRDFDKEVAGFLSQFRGRVVPIALLVAVLGVLLAHFLSRRMAQPLISLEAAAREVRLGNLDVEVPQQSEDEVGRLAASFNEMVSGLKQRDQIKGLFKRYLNPQVVEELIRHPEKAAPGGQKRTLTVLFSDLVGFTGFAERLSPEELVGLLNRYFENATRALAKRDATLDKFIGDAIMCFWNAPLLQEDHARKACLTALDLLEVVDALAPELAQHGVTTFDCRIGINTGPCVVGNIGSAEAQYYTAMGDTVNLASRLEGAAKVYGVRTLVSEDTVRQAQGAVLTRELDLVRVKGRKVAVRVYELIGREGDPVAREYAAYAKALELYREAKFREALQHFEVLEGADKPSRVFAERCRRYLVDPPPADWGGVHVLDTK